MSIAVDVQSSKQYLECILRRTSGELLNKILGAADVINMKKIELRVTLNRITMAKGQASHLDIEVNIIVEPTEESK